MLPHTFSVLIFNKRISYPYYQLATSSYPFNCNYGSFVEMSYRNLKISSRVPNNTHTCAVEWKCVHGLMATATEYYLNLR